MEFYIDGLVINQILDAYEIHLYWLSFCDSQLPQGQQFLGACIISAHNWLEAVTISHLFRINPGGEVQSIQIPDRDIGYEGCTKHWDLCNANLNRLMKLDELRELGFVPVNMDGERQ